VCRQGVRTAPQEKAGADGPTATASADFGLSAAELSAERFEGKGAGEGCCVKCKKTGPGRFYRFKAGFLVPQPGGSGWFGWLRRRPVCRDIRSTGAFVCRSCIRWRWLRERLILGVYMFLVVSLALGSVFLLALYRGHLPLNPHPLIQVAVLEQLLAFLCFGVVPLLDGCNLKAFRAEMARRAMLLAAADPEYARQGDYFWVE
jgi:hypothetical protein